jgi:hypothetical protein
MAKKRPLSIFSLAFLDVMSCGFGAVILIFLIVNHDAQQNQAIVNKDLLAEIRLLDYQVLQGEKDLFALIEAKKDSQARLSNAREQAEVIEKSLRAQLEKLSKQEASALSNKADAQRLRSDIESREREVKLLEDQKAANDGNQIRNIKGEGDRQYLTGMKIGGRNVVIIVDVSASMLDDTIVNVLRRRNMAEEKQRQAPKWQRAIRTVEWLSVQLPLDANFQLMTFSEATQTLLPSGDTNWQPMADGSQINDAIESLKKIIPKGGTNLEAAIVAIRDLSPIPDNVYFITDGLPTRDNNNPRSPTISSKKRLELFRSAAERLPRQIPVNVILFPMEGDPLAGAAWWQLARVSGGAFISPSWDWP